jgi:hypothetical protein
MYDDNSFDLFDFAEMEAAREQQKPAEITPPMPPPVPPVRNRKQLLQSAFAFLLSLKPDAAATNVSTRCSRYQAACAGFWKRANSRGRISITRTAVVVMYDDIDNCFTDCASREARMENISKLQQQKKIMEAEIRRTEPHLAAADDLFSDFRTWDYRSSSNREYHKLRRTLEKELHALCQGSRLEKIREAGVADLCYLAVPEKLIDPDMLLPTWGLVELSAASPRFKLIRQPEMQNNTTPNGRSNLAFNIASAALKATRFAAGIDANGKLRRPPRKRGFCK